jgi:hypothetical protein
MPDLLSQLKAIQSAVIATGEARALAGEARALADKAEAASLAQMVQQAINAVAEPPPPPPVDPPPVIPPPPSDAECPECDWAEAIIAAADPADVLLVDGTTHTVTGEESHKYVWVRNGGTLRHAEGSTLRTHLGVIHDSLWLAGTPDAPVGFNVVFTGAIDPATDPHQIGGQILVHNSPVRIYGKETPGWLKPNGFPDKNVTTRAITFRSADYANRLARGCLMLMTNDVVVHHAAFVDMGRSDKSKPITDFPNVTNLRGRYPLHFHLPGTLGTPADVTGCLGVDSPCSQFVNHGGNVVFTRCLSVRAYGAGFWCEIGGEAGGIMDCGVNDVHGDTGEETDKGDRSGTAVDDWGFGGHAFFGLEGGPFRIDGLEVDGCDNIAVMRVAAKNPYMPTAAITGDDYAPLGAWLADPANAKVYPPGQITASEVPTFDRGVYVKNSRESQHIAAMPWAVCSTSQNRCRSLFADSMFEHTGFENGYAGYLDLKNITAVADPANLKGWAFAHTGIIDSCGYYNLTAKDWLVGIQAPSRGDNVISGCTLGCACDILILNQSTPAWYVKGSGKPTRTLTIDPDNIHLSPTVDPATTPVAVEGQVVSALPARKLKYAFVMKYVWIDIDAIKKLSPDNDWVYTDLFHWRGTLGYDSVQAPHTVTGEMVYLYPRERGRSYPLAGLPIPPQYLTAPDGTPITTAGQLYDVHGLALWGSVPVVEEPDMPDAECIWSHTPPQLIEEPKMPVRT